MSGYRIDFGPSYRAYFGTDGPAPIILLGGGTKSRQQQDVKKPSGSFGAITSVEYERRATNQFVDA